VCPKPMIAYVESQPIDPQKIASGKKEKPTSCNAETSHKVICNSKDGCLDLERGRVCGDEAIDGDSDDEGHVQPVDMLEPVCAGDGLLGDVSLLHVELARGGLRHARRLLCLRSHCEGWQERDVSWKRKREWWRTATRSYKCLLVARPCTSEGGVGRQKSAWGWAREGGGLPTFGGRELRLQVG